MLGIQNSPEYSWYLSTQAARPVTNNGVTVTPGNPTAHTKGAWAQLIAGASVTEDVWYIRVQFNSNAVSGINRSSLADIGIDPAGGTTYTVLLADLLLAGAPTYSVAGTGTWYAFPIHIPSGSSIGCRYQTATPGAGPDTMNCWAQLYGLPRHPETTRKGTFVRSFGAVGGSSTGTTVTPGAGADGAWAQVGSATVDDLWWWQLGAAHTSLGSNSGVLHLSASVGTASNKRIVIADAVEVDRSNEEVNVLPHEVGVAHEVLTGDLVYCKAWSNTTAQTGFSMMAYGVGG